MKTVVAVCLGFLLYYAVYHTGRAVERHNIETRIALFAAQVECPDQDWLYAKSIDLRTGEVKCRYYFKGART